MKNKGLISLLLIGGLCFSLFLIPTSRAASTRSGSISGTVSYAGTYDTNHEISISAHLSPGQEPVTNVEIFGPGDYTLNLADGDYFISAFLDIHDIGGGPPNAGEPLGWYDSNDDGNPDPVTIAGNSLTNIDILLEDVTSDYIQGTACYLGGLYGSGGRLEVGLQTDFNSEPVTHQFISLPCDEYIFSNIQPGSYYVYLFYDLDGSGEGPEPGEPFGYYDGNGDSVPDLLVFEDDDVITGIDITLDRVHYVDFSAAGEEDGTSWEDAFTDLQDALAIAKSGEEIWVASGIYTPGTTRDATFLLKGGVAMYGGFAGTENYRYQRNMGANTTVLSGDIGNLGVKSDNVYHVVTAVSTPESTILDGFTITGGYANDVSGNKDKAGGFLNSSGNPTLANLNFIDNYAFNHGGAIATMNNNEPLTIINTTFSGNSSENNAGGIANLEGNILVINSTLVRNSGGNGGGIVTMGVYDNPTAVRTEIHNSILWDNPGGQITYVNYPPTIIVSNSLVEGGYPGGTDILTDNPLFVDTDGADNLYGTWDDDLHLQGSSPAISSGDALLLPQDLADSDGDGDIFEDIPLDFDGGARVVDTLDMGADEFDTAQAVSGLQIATSQPMLAGQAIYFAAQANVGTQMTYTWDFGDGNTESGPVPTHIYTQPGVYQVVLRAENDLGLLQTTIEIEVGQSLIINEGTSLQTSDGILSIAVPAGVGNTTIIYTPQTEPLQTPGSLSFAGIAFQLDAFDGESNPIIEPTAPFTLTLHYDESSLPSGISEEDLQVFRYDVDLTDWVALDIITHDMDNDTLTVELDHFSDFALFSPRSTINLFLPLIIR